MRAGCVDLGKGSKAASKMGELGRWAKNSVAGALSGLLQAARRRPEKGSCHEQLLPWVWSIPTYIAMEAPWLVVETGFQVLHLTGEEQVRAWHRAQAMRSLGRDTNLVLDLGIGGGVVSGAVRCTTAPLPRQWR
jgi:hypothetical protein